MPPLKKLRQMRQLKNITGPKLAATLGISKQQYSMLERGQRRLSYDMAVKIAAVFDTTPDEIFLPSEHAAGGQKSISSRDSA